MYGEGSLNDATDLLSVVLKPNLSQDGNPNQAHSPFSEKKLSCSSCVTYPRSRPITLAINGSIAHKSDVEISDRLVKMDCHFYIVHNKVRWRFKKPFDLQQAPS